MAGGGCKDEPGTVQRGLQIVHGRSQRAATAKRRQGSADPAARASGDRAWNRAGRGARQAHQARARSGNASVGQPALVQGCLRKGCFNSRASCRILGLAKRCVRAVPRLRRPDYAAEVLSKVTRRAIGMLPSRIRGDTAHLVGPMTSLLWPQMPRRKLLRDLGPLPAIVVPTCR